MANSMPKNLNLHTRSIVNVLYGVFTFTRRLERNASMSNMMDCTLRNAPITLANMTID